MNINFNSVVNVVKGFAASEGGKAVINAGKSIGNKALKGFSYGAGVGALWVGTKFGYKAATKGLPAVCRPVEEILGHMTAGDPDFTVTFRKCEAPKKDEETKENDSEDKSEK